jgi:hypothetical protein
MSSAYHPQTDGQTEIVNKQVQEKLRAYVNFEQNDWDLYLVPVEFAINNTIHRVTGFSPFYMDTGRHPRVPSLVDTTSHNEPVNKFVQRVWGNLEWARNRMIQEQQKQADNYNRHRTEFGFSVGDKVLLSREHAL